MNSTVDNHLAEKFSASPQSPVGNDWAFAYENFFKKTIAIKIIMLYNNFIKY